MEESVQNKKTGYESELELLQLSREFFKLFAIVLCGYALGWMGFSFAWLLLGAFVWTLRQKYFKDQNDKLKLIRSIGADEKAAITCSIKDLPSWVYFPDTERAEWLNKILRQLWPFIDEYVKSLIKQSIEPSITASLPEFLKSFRFEKVDLGTVPVRIGSVKCYDENTSRQEIILDMEIIYAGNCDIQMRIKGMKAGIKDLQLYGMVRVELRPLLKEMPLVGCVSFYFLNSPAIEFNLTNLADILDMPGLSDYLRRAIKEQLAALVVLPNKYVFPLVNDLSMKSIKFLQPAGIIRLEIIEAKNLVKSDVGMLGMGKSDPYVRILVGSQEFKSPVIYNTVNPKWNYACEVVVYHLHDQNIEIEVMDEDQGSKDDFLGRASLSLNTISKDGSTEAWLTLKDVKTGALHAKATWFTLSDNIEHLSAASKESQLVKSKYKSTQGQAEGETQLDGRPIGSVAVVLIYLDCARNLPIINKAAGEPDTYCIISLGRQQRHSVVKNSTANPIWEETFDFLVDQFDYDAEISLELIDTKIDRLLGNATLKLQKVVSSQDLTFDQPLAIKGRATDCELHLSVKVRLLKAQQILNSPKLIVEEPMETEKSNIPTLEDLIKGTVQPIINTSGLKKDIIAKSQNDRKHSHIKTNGCQEETADTQSTKGTLNSKYPRIQLTLQRNDSNQIFLILHKAENLPKSNDKKPDPYVKIMKLSEKTSNTFRDSKLKSDTKRNTCDPVFEESFELDDDSQELTGLEIVVYSRNGSNLFKKKPKIIGMTSIELNGLKQCQQITEWYDLEQTTD